MDKTIISVTCVKTTRICSVEQTVFIPGIRLIRDFLFIYKRLYKRANYSTLRS